jgi:hypothetical protein
MVINIIIIIIIIQCNCLSWTSLVYVVHFSEIVIQVVCFEGLALTSPTGGGRSVGIVRSRTKATEFSLV